MNNQSTDRIVSRLREVLAAERSFLKNGQVHDAASLAEEKLGAVEAFEGMLFADPPAGLTASQRIGVREVVDMARENAIVLDSVRNGLRSVAARLENLDGGSNVGAYDQYGTKLPFSGATGGYVKRV